MDISLAIGLLVAFGSIGISVIMGGGDISGLVNIPSAIIVFGGSFGVAIVAYGLPQFLKAPKLIMLVIRQPQQDADTIITQIVNLAEKARREGLLSLEDEAEQITDPLLRKGLTVVIDGTDPEQVRSILEIDVANMGDRHEVGYKLMEEIGSYGPAMGITGTIMGLIAVLANLGGDTAELGAGVAIAFLTTLYGVMMANLVFNPISRSLTQKSNEEIRLKTMAIEGVMSIQAGDNPRLIEERLTGYLSPDARSERAQGAEA